jgi:hypothetical protein
MEKKKVINLGMVGAGVHVSNVRVSGRHSVSLLDQLNKPKERSINGNFSVPNEIINYLPDNFFKLQNIGDRFFKRETSIYLKQEMDSLIKVLNCGRKEAEAAFYFTNPKPRKGTHLVTKKRVCQFPYLVQCLQKLIQNNEVLSSPNLKNALIDKGFKPQTSEHISYLLLSKKKQL